MIRKVFFFFLWSNTISHACETEIHSNDNNVNFKWTNRNSGLTISNPPCFINGELFLRDCSTNGSWIPSNYDSCQIIPSSMNRRCPDDLIEIPVQNDFICIKLSDQADAFSKLSNMCYGANAKTLEKLKQREWTTLLTYLEQTKNITEFWMPVNRVDNNDYHPFVWRLPGKRWGRPLSKNHHNLINESRFGENCVKIVAKDQTVTYEVTHCDDLLFNLCIFKDKFVVKSTCKNNFAAIRYKPNVCYGLEEDVKSTEINLIEYIENAATIRRIVNFMERRQFRLMEAEGKGYQLLVNEQGLFEISNRTVKFHLAKEIIESTHKKVEFILKFDKETKRLLLTAYFRKYLYRVNRDTDEEEDDDDNFGIHCFTNAGYDIVTPVKIEKVWEEDEDKPKSIFQLKLYGDGPGYYWCEGHTVFNFQFIQSQKIVATKKQKGHSFVFTYKFACGNENCGIDTLEKTGKFIEKDLVAASKSSTDTRNLVIHNVRIMKIEEANILYMTALCHVTASLKSSSVDNSSEESSEEDDEVENEFGIRHDTDVRMEIRGFLKTVLLRTGNVGKVNSTEFCFPEYFFGNERNIWTTANLGTTSTAKKICLQNDGLVVTRKCKGSFLYGAMWEKAAEDIQCVNPDKTEQTVITDQLYEIERSDETKVNPNKVIDHVREIIKANKDNLIPADLFYIGKILNTVSDELAGNSTASVGLANNIISIFNHLMDINTSITKSSVKLNSTNILLDAFEKLIDEIFTSPPYTENFDYIPTTTIESSSSMEFQSVEFGEEGVFLKLKSKLAIFIIDPSVANVSGVVLYGEDNSDRRNGEIGDTYFRFLYTNQTTNELLGENDDDIQMAAYFPSTLLQRLDEIRDSAANLTAAAQLPTPQPRPPLRIIIKIYSNDNLFQENYDNEEDEKHVQDGMVSNKIISISVPGHSNDLPEMLPLIIKKGSKAGRNDSTFLDGCYYWNYNKWQDDGVFSQSSDKLSLCNCTHLTPFAYLIGGVINTAEVSDYVLKTKVEQHQSALNIITFVGCTLSMVGITGIMVTAFVIKSWRKTLSAKVLLHLSGAIAFQMILFLFVNTEYVTKHVLEEKIFSSCVIIGASLHYSVLVQFCWMLVIAYLQYKRYVQVLGKTRPKRFLLKAALVGWGVPLIPVVLVIIIDRQSYIPLENIDDSLKVCYPSGNSLYYGIMAPVGGIIIANLVIFVIVVYNVVKGPDEALHQTENKKFIMPHIRLSVLLFFLLGCTWSFGLLTALKAGILFSYLFCLTATLQGFILFMYFIILDPTTRKLWIKRLQGIANFSSTSRTSKDFEDSTNGYNKY